MVLFCSEVLVCRRVIDWISRQKNWFGKSRIVSELFIWDHENWRGFDVLYLRHDIPTNKTQEITTMTKTHHIYLLMYLNKFWIMISFSKKWWVTVSSKKVQWGMLLYGGCHQCHRQRSHITALKWDGLLKREISGSHHLMWGCRSFRVQAEFGLLLFLVHATLFMLPNVAAVKWGVAAQNERHSVEQEKHGRRWSAQKWWRISKKCSDQKKSWVLWKFPRKSSTSSTEPQHFTDFPIFFRNSWLATGGHQSKPGRIKSHKMTNAWYKDVFKNNTQNARCLYNIYIYICIYI